MPHLMRATSLVAVLIALVATSAVAQDPGPRSVVVESVLIEPSQPGVDTLCRLKVTLRNDGDQTASQLGFSVRLNDQDLTVYGNQLFMYPLPAGSSTEVPLYNFWTTETSRPAPTDGKLTVEVVLLEAQWMDIQIDSEGVEVWNPLGEVDGLPSSHRVTLDLSKAD